MKQEMFSVYDQKVRAFCIPFFSPNEQVAIRAFAYSANDLNTDIGRYPTDFSLFKLASFDDTTGTVEVLSEPLHLTLALTLVNSGEEQQDV